MTREKSWPPPPPQGDPSSPSAKLVAPYRTARKRRRVYAEPEPTTRLNMGRVVTLIVMGFIEWWFIWSLFNSDTEGNRPAAGVGVVLGGMINLVFFAFIVWPEVARAWDKPWRVPRD